MVEKEEGEFHSALRQVVSDTFEVVPSRSSLPDVDEDGDFLDFVDCIYHHRNTVYYVTAKERLGRDDVARALLAKNLVESRKRKGTTVVFVLMAKKVPKRVSEMASAVGLDTIRLAIDFPLPTRKSSSRNRISKLSHPRSWQIVTRLLWSGPSSIRQLSKVEGVSYSWTHATVTRLLEMGVAERSPSGIRIVDLDRLMDGISWERPLNQLQIDEIPLTHSDYMEAALEIEEMLGQMKTEHAFTGFTAGGIYTGSGQRFDRLYLYVGKSARKKLRNMMNEEGGDVTLLVYRYEKDHLGRTETRDGLTLASPSLTLLDLIGLGYKARALAKEMVKEYESSPDE